MSDAWTVESGNWGVNEKVGRLSTEIADWERRYTELLDHATGLRTVADAASAFVRHHQKGQPKIPGTLYPMTYIQQDAWRAEWHRRLAALVEAVETMPQEVAGSPNERMQRLREEMP